MKRTLVIGFLLLWASSLTLGSLLLGRLAARDGTTMPRAAARLLMDWERRVVTGAPTGRSNPTGGIDLGPDLMTPPDDGPVDRIAFIDRQGQVATMAADGSGRRTLSATGRRFAFPTWSPEGRRLAVIGASAATAGIYLVADRPDSRPLAWHRDADQEPFYLFWAPGGTSIGFLAARPDGVGLHVRGLADKEDRRLTRSASVYLDWQADGSQVLVHSRDAGEDGNGRLSWLDALPSESTPTADAAGGTIGGKLGRFQAPGISASGRFLAFSSLDGESQHLTVVDQGEAGRPQRIAHRGDVALGWSPTAELLAYISPVYDLPSFAGPLRVLDPIRHTARALTTTPILGFFWAPDGRSIACFTLAGPMREPRIQAAFHPQSNHAPDEEPHLELWTVQVESGRHRRLAVFRPSTSFTEQLLPFFDQYAHSHRIWSPDSRAIVLPMREADGTTSINVISALTGERRRIAEGSMAFWSPR